MHRWSVHTLKKMCLRWRSWHSAGHTPDIEGDRSVPVLCHGYHTLRSWSKAKWFCEAGVAHLTKPGWSIPHTYSNPTNLALFRHKITLYRFNQGHILLRGGGSNGSRGLSPPSPPHFNHSKVSHAMCKSWMKLTAMHASHQMCGRWTAMSSFQLITSGAFSKSPPDKSAGCEWFEAASDWCVEWSETERYRRYHCTNQ